MLDAISRGSEPLLDNPLYTPRASLTLQGALDEAPPLGHNYIGTEHILLGMLRDRDGVGAGVLGAFRRECRIPGSSSIGSVPRR